MAAAVSPQDIDAEFAKSVKKSSKEADKMEHKDQMENPGVVTAIKDKVMEGVHKVAEAAHRLVGNDPPTREGDDKQKEPPIGDESPEAAEYYGEHASQKFDSEKSSLSSQQRKSTD